MEAGGRSCLCLTRTRQGRDRAGRGERCGGHWPVLPPCTGTSSLAWHSSEAAQESKEQVFLPILMPAETVHSEGAEWRRRQHITAPNTCSCCDPCTKHRAVREWHCAALQAESPASAESCVPRASAGAQTCGIGPQKRGDRNGVCLKNDKGWMLLFIHLPRGLYFQAF